MKSYKFTLNNGSEFIANGTTLGDAIHRTRPDLTMISVSRLEHLGHSHILRIVLLGVGCTLHNMINRVTSFFSNDNSVESKAA